MAETQKKLNSKKRFGARYGRTIKTTLAKIEGEHRKLHKCPYCSKVGVKRLSAGIWHCKKCGSKFTGKAYTIKGSVAKQGKEDLIIDEDMIKEEDS